MPGKRHSEEQIPYALRQIEGGKKVSEVCREMEETQPNDGAQFWTHPHPKQEATGS